MNSDEIIARLRENEAVLRKRASLGALFGSRARGDPRPESDTDIMIELDPTARITVFDYAGLKDYIADLFDGQVDVVNRDGLNVMRGVRRDENMFPKRVKKGLLDLGGGGQVWGAASSVLSIRPGRKSGVLARCLSNQLC